MLLDYVNASALHLVTSRNSGDALFWPGTLQLKESLHEGVISGGEGGIAVGRTVVHAMRAEFGTPFNVTPHTSFLRFYCRSST